MKNSIISILVLLFLAPMAFAYAPDWDFDAPCGWDFQKSEQVGVPRTYCWARQDRGHQTFNGFLGKPCSGSACPVPNQIN